MTEGTSTTEAPTRIPAAPDALVGVDWVCQRLGIAPVRAYEMAREGDLPSVRLGRAVRFDKAIVEAWIANGGTAGE